MKTLGLSQRYMAIAGNEKNIWGDNGNENRICLMAAGIWELEENGIIDIDSDVVIIRKDLPYERRYLAPLYEYIEQKGKVSLDEIAVDYASDFSDSEYVTLAESIIESIAGVGEIEIITSLKLTMLDGTDKETERLIVLLNRIKKMDYFFAKAEMRYMKKTIKNALASRDAKLLRVMINYSEVVACLCGFAA